MDIKACGLLVCLALPFAGCTTVPETGRTQFNVMSAEQEMELGFSSFEQFKRDTPINRDPEINAIVQRVGRRIDASGVRDETAAADFLFE